MTKHKEINDFSFMKSDPKPKRKKEYYGETVIFFLLLFIAIIVVCQVGGEFLSQRKSAFINNLEWEAKSEWCISEFESRDELPKACAKYL